MKQLLFLLALLPVQLFAQGCDTLYSDDKEFIERSVSVVYSNCYYLDIDTTYTIYYPTSRGFEKPTVQLEKGCYVLLDAKDKHIILDRKTSGDTTYYTDFYASGKLRAKGFQSVVQDDEYQYCMNYQTFYENGQLKVDESYEHNKVTRRKTYYEDGTLQSTGFYYSSPMSPVGTRNFYYPNGKIAIVSQYSSLDTSDVNYPKTQLLSQQSFDQKGKEIDESPIKVGTLYLVEDRKDEILELGKGLYTHYQFSNQPAYANNGQALRERILAGITLPSDCDCTKGVVWISLLVTKTGKVQLDEVQFDNKSLRKQVEKSIKKIKTWPAGTVDGNPVDAYVYTYLIVD